MFFLLPYAHEKQTVQRLPWVTFGLIAINVIVFFFTFYGRPDDRSAQKALIEFEKYYYAHPYLEIPDEIRQFFDKHELDRIALLKEGSDLSQSTAESRRLEQMQLNALADKVLEYIHQNPFQKYGYVPGNSKWYTLITCQFVHTGWMHLIGNMLFLYLAGCSIEDLWGRPLYIAFYLTSGVVATLFHDFKFTESMVPLVGASGAIAGLMGAFLIRMYKTKIYFIYALFLFFRFRFGTFGAPAYVMLPLWLLQQIFFAGISDESAGVAFWAHIGGFLFGMGVAYAVKTSRVEERFIAPAIEKKVSLAQNPDFLRAMEISEKGDFPNALILLEKVIRQEPNHLDAYMEMRRIAEVQKDPQLYTRYSGAIFDILLRNRDYDLLTDLYAQYQSYRSPETLPAKTLFGLANYFEDSSDFSGAVKHYQELAAAYPDDALAIKALNKIYKISFDRLSNREEGIQAYWKCKRHPQAIDQWQTVLEADRKKYNIPDAQSSAPAPVANEQEAFQPGIPAEAGISFSAVASLISNDAALPVVENNSYRQFAPAAASTDPVLLPDAAFHQADTGTDWFVIACVFEKLTLKGVMLRSKQGAKGLLPWKKIQTVSVGKIRQLDPGADRNNREFLLLDLIVPDVSGALIYRIAANKLEFGKIFPGVEQTFEEAFHNFVGIIANNSGARCIPSREACTGPSFASYPDEDRYNARVKEKIVPA